MRLFLLTLLLIPMSLSATDLVVDGPGDGDGDGTDDLDSIQAAIEFLGEGQGTDGLADEIIIMVDELNEPSYIHINGQSEPEFDIDPVRDDITIRGDADGNGVSCVVDIFGSFYGFFNVDLADGQDVKLHDLDFWASLPSETEFLDVQGVGVGPPFLGSSLTIDNVMISNGYPSPRHNPSDENAPQSTWRGAGIHLNRNADHPGHPVDVRIIDSEVVGQSTNGITLEMEAGSAEIINTRVCRKGIGYTSGDRDGDGICIVSLGDVNVTVEGVSFEENLSSGLRITSPPEGYESNVTIGPGCHFANNWGVGAKISARGVLNITGERDNPIKFVNDHVVIGVGSDAATVEMRHVIITDTYEPLRLGVNADHSPAIEISDCLFADGIPEYEPRVGIPFVGPVVRTRGPAQISFQRCTFHNAHPHRDSPTIPRLFSIEAESRLRFSDCIFSGDGDEYVFNTVVATEVSLELTNCAIVTDGDHAVLSEWATGEGTINLTDCIFIDPQYLNVNTPPDEDSFDVNSAFFGNAGPGGGPLSGWGDYVGTPWEGGGAGVEVH